MHPLHLSGQTRFVAVRLASRRLVTALGRPIVLLKLAGSKTKTRFPLRMHSTATYCSPVIVKIQLSHNSLFPSLLFQQQQQQLCQRLLQQPQFKVASSAWYPSGYVFFSLSPSSWKASVTFCLSSWIAAAEPERSGGLSSHALSL